MGGERWLFVCEILVRGRFLVGTMWGERDLWGGGDFWRLTIILGYIVAAGVKFFWKGLVQPLFLHSFLRIGLPDSIMVVRQILVLFVLVRIQVGQLGWTT